MLYNGLRNTFRVSALALTPALFLAASAFAQQQPNGVANFHVVNEHLYRGGQPSDLGFRELAKMGVTTVLDLREPDSRSLAEKTAVEATGMKYVNVPMYGISKPSAAQIESALSVLNAKNAGTVFVHCRRGADRTGTVIACYRVAHDGWNNAKALGEAKGFGLTWLATGMHSLISSYRPPLQNASAAGDASVMN
jgi:tyrosine-protein phosphatase SIW14